MQLATYSLYLTFKHSLCVTLPQFHILTLTLSHSIPLSHAHSVFVSLCLCGALWHSLYHLQHESVLMVDGDGSSFHNHLSRSFFCDPHLIHLNLTNWSSRSHAAASRKLARTSMGSGDGDAYGDADALSCSSTISAASFETRVRDSRICVTDSAFACTTK